MAHDPDNIYKALRMVPEFDGNPNVLTRFIRICDQLVTQFICTDPGHELANLCLINGILNKITGPASRTINANGIPDNWLGIRNALINNFADQRDESALYNDLSLLAQGNDSPQEFYDKCQTLFSTIMTYVTLHEIVPTTVEAKRDLYRKLTMQSYVRGLKEPLGARIRCMRPPTIEKALEFVQEELNVMYLQHRNEPSRNPAPQTSKVPYLTPNNLSVPKGFNFGVQRPMPMQPQPQLQPQPQHWRPAFQFHPPQRMTLQPSRTQQMFRAPPPNYNAQNSGFRFPPRNAPPQNLGPKPMSGVSHYVTKALPPTIQGHDWRKFGNPPPTNYFKSREMNYNEVGDYSDYYYPEYYYPESDYPETDNGNFYGYQSVPEYYYDQQDDSPIPDSVPPSSMAIEPAQLPSEQKEQDFPSGRSNRELK